MYTRGYVHKKRGWEEGGGKQSVVGNCSREQIGELLWFCGVPRAGGIRFLFSKTWERGSQVQTRTSQTAGST